MLYVIHVYHTVRDLPTNLTLVLRKLDGLKPSSYVDARLALRIASSKHEIVVLGSVFLGQRLRRDGNIQRRCFAVERRRSAIRVATPRPSWPGKLLCTAFTINR